MKKWIVAGTLTLISQMAFAGPSPAVKSKVQSAMKSFVIGQTSSKGLMPVIYKGKVLQLKVLETKKYPDGFHAGVQQDGNLYTSCADFIDPKTKKVYDIDFLVNKVGDSYKVVQPIVHSVDGKKNPYDLDH